MIRALILLFFVASSVGCSISTRINENNNKDPLEDLNRIIWEINYDYLDPYILYPVSFFYISKVPIPIRSCIKNFLGNLSEPSSMINTLLMQDPKKSLHHFNRFLLNSTFGMLGCIDVASLLGINSYSHKKFSHFLGYYGLENGPYLMLPFYGPLIPREIANLVDFLYPPLFYINSIFYLKMFFEYMESRFSLSSQEIQLKNSLDPYILFREMYLQNQTFKSGIKINDYSDDEEDYLDIFLDKMK
ncbi:phospholipid-binding lipoprotein [Candidatus Photodesmus katoptron]|uniref:VacJ like protein n=1 Tax=Candidatus Photodesmus katoptron Akat1 TaxID=1236703 RepID=S3DKN9_9GAMM|nr:MlaA family lipoprotein [Candidatus Photodesmus katoptron]EPE37689.1 vacJ like protein [Candidatus Photodesmus katoptron Akat1]KEY90590.1 phospholipid-binding lipoprotein [Candidatus Photodesmus katoptron]